MSSSSSSTPEPLDPRFQLKLPSFEGPLDLLLHLCQKHELDIVNLPVAFVTERYLEYIHLMERLDLDIASEYLVMAATLAHIKSKSLLPPDPTQDAEEGAEEEEIDPRQELIRRLLEYQKYKAAAEELGARGVQGRDVFTRGMDAPEATGPAPLAGVGLFKLLDAFQAVLKRAKQDLAFQITAEGVSIQDRMSQLAERLRSKRRCTFDELFDDVKTMYDVVVTFLAILEMAKRRLARIYQSEPIAPIHLEYRVLDADGEEAAAEAGAPDSGTPEAAASADTAPAGPDEAAASADTAPAGPDEAAASADTAPAGSDEAAPAPDPVPASVSASQSPEVPAPDPVSASAEVPAPPPPDLAPPSGLTPEEEAEWAALLAEEAALEAARAAERAADAGAKLDLEPDVAQDPRPAEPGKSES